MRRWLQCVVGALAIAMVSATETADWVPLKTSFPEAFFDLESIKGGPVTFRNIDLKLKQPPLLVPPGMENLALGKSVESSDLKAYGGGLERVTDGDKVEVLELNSGWQWVQIDLEMSSEIHGVWIWHDHRSVRAYVDVVVQVSDDKDFADGKETTIYNADHDNSLGLGQGRDLAYLETHRGRVIAADGAKGRYVRLYSNGSTSSELNHYLEVEVWGRK